MRIRVRWWLPLVVSLLVMVGWQVVGQRGAIATAPQPPSLSPAKLGGKPVYVLYVTRSEDTVLVRCYPGQTPTLTVREMGGQPGVREGVLICR